MPKSVSVFLTSSNNQPTPPKTLGLLMSFGYVFWISFPTNGYAGFKILQAASADPVCSALIAPRAMERSTPAHPGDKSELFPPAFNKKTQMKPSRSPSLIRQCVSERGAPVINSPAVFLPSRGSQHSKREHGLHFFACWKAMPSSRNAAAAQHKEKVLWKKKKSENSIMTINAI